MRKEVKEKNIKTEKKDYIPNNQVNIYENGKKKVRRREPVLSRLRKK